MPISDPVSPTVPSWDRAPAPSGAGSASHVDAAAGGPHTLRIVPWPDAVIDALGHDPRSWYVEQFWLGVIGPTATWLLRRLAAGFDAEPGGFELDLGDTARALGLGGRVGRHSPFQRAISRCVTFQLGRLPDPSTLAVRRRIPPLPRRYLLRLPPTLQELHRGWSGTTRPTPDVDEMRERSRRLALQLLEAGGDRRAVESQLMRWRVHPALAHESVEWACVVRCAAPSPHP